MAKLASVLVLGKLPPPIGGVTMSVKNTVVALKSKGLRVAVFPNGLFKRYDIAHAHNYKPWKRCLMLLLGKVLAKKNVFTIHGMHFKQDLILNRLNVWLADGVIVQNDLVLESAPNLRDKVILKIGSLVKEGLDISSNSDSNLILGPKSKPRLLVYAQHAEQYEGKNIYGVPFVIDLLDRLATKYTIVLADVSNAYAHLDTTTGSDLVRIDHAVNFTQLLSEVDMYLRPTSKDGDSVAVLEAIMLGVPVIASDVTERRKEVTLYEYGSAQSFFDALERAEQSKGTERLTELPSIDEYVDFYTAILTQSP